MLQSDIFGFFGVLWKWGRLFLIHPLHTTPPLEYGPVARFSTAMVFLFEAGRALEFAGKTKGGVQPKQPVQVQGFRGAWAEDGGKEPLELQEAAARPRCLLLAPGECSAPRAKLAAGWSPGEAQPCWAQHTLLALALCSVPSRREQLFTTKIKIEIQYYKEQTQNIDRVKIQPDIPSVRVLVAIWFIGGCGPPGVTDVLQLKQWSCRRVQFSSRSPVVMWKGSSFPLRFSG